MHPQSLRESEGHYLAGIQIRFVTEGAPEVADVLGLDLEGVVGLGTLAAAPVGTLQHRHHLPVRKYTCGFMWSLCLFLFFAFV